MPLLSGLSISMYKYKRDEILNFKYRKEIFIFLFYDLF